MIRFATLALAALALSAPAGAQGLLDRTHDTGTAALRVFNTGYYGNDVGNAAFADTTFTFGAAAPLYEGQLIVAVSPTQISGEPYSNSPPTGGGAGAGYEWTLGVRPAAITPPAPFTQAYQTAYSDTGTNNTSPAGISVVQQTYSRTGDPFVFVEVQVSSTVSRTGVYIGMFADFDISPTAILDVGGFDAPTRTVYANSIAATGNRNFYGVTLIGRQQSGWSATAQLDNATVEANEAELYAALSANGTPATVGGDRRLAIGAGPFTLAAGVAQTVRFAYVGGASLVAFQQNAAAAQALFPTAGEDGPSASAGLRIAPPVPNPATGQAAVTFELDAAQTARLAVYDVLGREVAVLADGAQAAGAHTVALDASALPAGVYVARLTAGGQSVTRRLTVAR